MARIYHRRGGREGQPAEPPGVQNAGCLGAVALAMLLGGVILFFFPDAEEGGPTFCEEIWLGGLSQTAKALYTAVYFLGHVIFVAVLVYLGAFRARRKGQLPERKASAIAGAAFLGLIGWVFALDTLVPPYRPPPEPVWWLPLPLPREAFQQDAAVSYEGWAQRLSPPLKALWFVGLVLAFAAVGSAVGYFHQALTRNLRIGRRGGEA